LNILVTGGAGFIGANFLNISLPRFPQYRFINLDRLSYAANLLSLKHIEGLPNYFFVQADIRDLSSLIRVFEQYEPDLVVHFAAESHVDKSIVDAEDFIQTNIAGTFNLLEVCRRFWHKQEGKLFHYVGTDEVYGSHEGTGSFTEEAPYRPGNPYAATKAAAAHLARSFFCTYGLPVTGTNCSNNYGPYQFPEKLIPLVILNSLAGKLLPVYGTGNNVRDWLHAGDHCEAIWAVLQKGKHGEFYNVGAGNERQNIDVVHKICEALAGETNSDACNYKKLITFVDDRPGHDFRYSIDTAKIRSLGWQPRQNFDEGLRNTVRWYIDNSDWHRKGQAK
jgi:dTDP-glucose 4,6-dehydratase